MANWYTLVIVLAQRWRAVPFLMGVRMRLDFAVTGLARSRTAWWAAFLSDHKVSCKHEYGVNVYKPEDYLGAYEPGKISGVSDTCFWLLADRAGLIAKKTLVIHRDPSEVQESVFRAFGVNIDFTPLAEHLWRVKGMHVDFHALAKKDIVAECYEYLTGNSPDKSRLDLFADMRIENMAGEQLMKSITPQHFAAVEVQKCL